MSKGEKRRRAKAAAVRRQKKADQKRLEEFGFLMELKEHQHASTTATRKRASSFFVVVEVGILSCTYLCDDRHNK